MGLNKLFFALLVVGGVWFVGDRLMNRVAPVLQGHEAYIGRWVAKGVEFEVNPHGVMSFSREATPQRLAEWFVNVPIVRINDHEIQGRVNDARIEVVESPHKVGAEWRMKLNDVELVKN